MSNSSLVNYIKISPNKTSTRNHAIDTITIHCMAGDLSVETCGNVFAKRTRNASSNYGIGSDGRIALYVEEKDRSWCSSNKANDHRAITIEVANNGGAPDWPVSDLALNSLINLCVDICKRNGIKKLVWSTNKSDRVNHRNGCNMTVHRDYANKACPGNYLYVMMGYIAKTVNEKLSGNADNSNPYPVPIRTLKRTYPSMKGDDVKWLQFELGITVDGSFGGQTLKAVKEFQKAHGLDVDGKVGPATRKALLEN